MGKPEATMARASARPRRRQRSIAQRLNTKVIGIRDWGQRALPMFSASPAFDMGGDDKAAAERLELLLHYADQLSRALFRLQERGWRGTTGGAGGRDARLPTVGTKLARDYKGRTHTVVVTLNGFEYQGKTYPSISAVGRRITRAATNGYKFFGLAAA